MVANSENGVKHCIALAYDSDLRKRTIFVHVFARVLGKGTKFEPQRNPELQARRNQLREVRPFVTVPELELISFLAARQRV